jgi:hypothetical protein
MNRRNFLESLLALPLLRLLPRSLDTHTPELIPPDRIDFLDMNQWAVADVGYSCEVWFVDKQGRIVQPLHLTTTSQR